MVLPGIMYFYIHFVTEVLCYFFLYSIVGDSFILWLAPLIYDILAFVPQILIGAINDRFIKIPFGIIGMTLLITGLLFSNFFSSSLTILNVIIIALGSSCIHVDGAEVTLRNKHGKIAPAAIYVAGGSFGVITGKLLASLATIWPLLSLATTTIPIIILAQKYKFQTKNTAAPCKNYNYSSKAIATWIIALAAAFVVLVRGFIGYGIPTNWNQTVLQAVMLFSFMGIGKALGGILVDTIGIRKTAYISMVGALPFLVFGNDNMIVSLIGITLFSMSMAISLAILVSAFPKTPGFAFGITTVALVLSAIPLFFFKMNNQLINIVAIIIASFICLSVTIKITRKEKNG